MNRVAYYQKCTELNAIATLPAARWAHSLDIMGVPVNVIEAVTRRRDMSPARAYYRVQFGIPPRQYTRRARALVSTPAAPAPRVETPAAPAPRVETPAAPAPLFARTFGVEIECYNATREAIISAARAQNQLIESQHYNHLDRGVAKIVSDSSLSGENTNEVVLPPAGDFAALEAFCTALKAAGAKVNRSCGLHVHIDARGMSPQVARRVVCSYRLMYDDICQILAPSRVRSQWARLNNEPCAVNTWRELRSFYHFDRYYAVNFEAYERHQTIEFRQHQGSVDFDKISRWVEFLQKLVTFSEQDEVLTPAHREELRAILARPVAHGRRLALTPAEAA